MDLFLVTMFMLYKYTPSVSGKGHRGLARRRLVHAVKGCLSTTNGRVPLRRIARNG